MIVTAPFDRIVTDLRQDFTRYQRRPPMAHHNLDTARWAVMGSTYSLVCCLCQHAHNPDYSRRMRIDGKTVRLCPDCMQEMRTGDLDTLIDLIDDADHD